MSSPNTDFREEVVDRLARIETKLDTIPDRVTALETAHAKLLGIAAFLAFAVSTASHFISRTFFTHQ